MDRDTSKVDAPSGGRGARFADDISAVRFNSDGLVPAIVQEHDTGVVLMMAWMNEQSLRETLDSGRTVFWSRSRGERWRKGDTSGDRQWVREVYYDCDGDTLLVQVDQEGVGACHTGERSCFHRSVARVGRGVHTMGTGPEGTGTTSIETGGSS
jgi:phosphoribosyl-AMP cyclohydrolase